MVGNRRETDRRGSEKRRRTTRNGYVPHTRAHRKPPYRARAPVGSTPVDLALTSWHH
ncbi:hypothetical protein QFZ71_002699 [Streptomyces sp. V2I9]|nr:hypothetical protein [Streptomyces sp. V2I9]